MSRRSHSLSSSCSTHAVEPVVTIAGAVGGAISKHVIEQTHPSQRPGVVLQHLGVVGVFALAAVLLGEKRVATEFARGYLSAWKSTT
jgi:hypothetical protein